jgi:hypothetical protein
MHSKQSNSATYRARAAAFSACAQQDVSAEAAAAFLYLEEMWLVIAEVADNLENISCSLVDDGSFPLSPE